MDVALCRVRLLQTSRPELAARLEGDVLKDRPPFECTPCVTAAKIRRKAIFETTVQFYV
jgi:hypothetical protein